MNTEEPSVDSEAWRAMLLGTHWQFRAGRRLLKHLPHEPRCKLCAAPFEGAAAPFMRLVGKSPWPKNPKYCGSCFKTLAKNHGGAEIPCSLLFADVRGSTRLAETMRPSDFMTAMDGFFRTASEILIEHDAVVDKFVGDEVVAIFIPALTGERHAVRAIAAGRALLVASGHGSPGPGLPIGVGVHTGIAFVGSIGVDANVDLTAMGDSVNVAARLASAAGSGEALVTIEAAQAGDLDLSGLEHRDLELKGKSTRTSVVVLRASMSSKIPPQAGSELV
jgi:adenylate cyclase